MPRSHTTTHDKAHHAGWARGQRDITVTGRDLLAAGESWDRVMPLVSGVKTIYRIRLWPGVGEIARVHYGHMKWTLPIFVNFSYLICDWEYAIGLTVLQHGMLETACFSYNPKRETLCFHWKNVVAKWGASDVLYAPSHSIQFMIGLSLNAFPRHSSSYLVYICSLKNDKEIFLATLIIIT